MTSMAPRTRSKTSLADMSRGGTPPLQPRTPLSFEKLPRKEMRGSGTLSIGVMTMRSLAIRGPNYDGHVGYFSGEGETLGGLPSTEILADRTTSSQCG